MSANKINPESGQVVDYLSGRRLKLGVTVKAAALKLSVMNGGGGLEQVPANAVIAVYGSTPETAAARRELGAKAGRLHELADKIDLDSVWRQARLKPDKDWHLEELTRLSSGGTEPESLGAMGRALLKDSVYFSGSPWKFRAAAPAEVKNARARHEAEQRRIQVIDCCREYLRPQKSAAPALSSVTEPVPGFIAEIRDYVLKDSSPALAELLAEVPPRTQPPRQKAVQILENLGLLPEHVERAVLYAGIAPEFSGPVQEQAAGLKPYVPDAKRIDHSSLNTFSIDDNDTLEVDDALSVELRGEDTVVGIHIADPGRFSGRDDVLDQTALARATTVYLPTGTLPMFPPRLSFDLASLNPGEIRPCLSFTAVFNAAGELLRTRLERAFICVKKRLNYEEADTLISKPDAEFPAPQLKNLFSLAKNLRRHRRTAGALTGMRPQFKIQAVAGIPSVKRTDREAPAQVLVSEMMILANRIAAEFAAARKIPFVFRNQEAGADNVFADISADSQAGSRPDTGRSLRRPEFSVTPASHAGLGLTAYCQTTSPLRRYTDLINIRQLTAALEGSGLAYSARRIEQILEESKPRIDTVRNLENEVNLFWILEYFKQLPREQKFNARIIRFAADGFCLVELTEFAVRGRIPEARVRSLKAGEPLEVRIQSVNPAAAELILC